MKLIIVHGTKEYFRDDQIRSIDQNKTFFHNVIIPGIALLPSCNSFMWIRREEINLQDLDPTFIFPRGYAPLQPVSEYVAHELVCARIRNDEVSYLKAPDYAKKIVNEFIKSLPQEREVITLTMRELDRDDPNNSRRVSADVWSKAIDHLANDFNIVVVRDTGASHTEKKLDNSFECPEASLHLHFRMALYELSFTNFIKNTGPGVLLLYGMVNCRYFGELDNDIVAVSESWFENNFGMTKGGQYPMTTASKRFVWESENFEEIISLAMKTNKNEKLSNQLNEINHSGDLLPSLSIALRQLLKNLNHNLLEEDINLFKSMRVLMHQHYPGLKIESLLVEGATTAAQKKGVEKIFQSS